METKDAGDYNSRYGMFLCALIEDGRYTAQGCWFASGRWRLPQYKVRVRLVGDCSDRY
jgi:hypothetical protein